MDSFADIRLLNISLLTEVPIMPTSNDLLLIKKDTCLLIQKFGSQVWSSVFFFFLLFP